MNNPLLAPSQLPPFSQIQVEHIEPAVDALLAQNRRLIAELTEQKGAHNWQSLVQVLEDAGDRLSYAWSITTHLNSVMNSDALRQVYNSCQQKLSAYWTEMGQHKGLFEAYERLASSDTYAQLEPAQQKVLEHALRDFRLSGIALPAEQQQRYAEIQQRLSALTSKFSENVLDATQGWYYHTETVEDLKGLPEDAIEAAATAAQQRELSGWVITLDFPAYYAVMTYADQAALREKLYRAYSTRASDQGPNAGRWDNGPVMDEILALRHELAQLLGFSHYADYSLATKMADTGQQVIGFLQDLAEKSRPVALQDLAELTAFATEQDGLEQLMPWDISYYAEKLKQSRYQVSQQQLRPYFPLPKVLNGLFAIVERLFGVQVEEQASVDAWHADVRLFRLSRDGDTLAYCYLDPFARSNKRGGAWMADCRDRRRLANGELQLPVAYLVCNFTPPLGDKPALLTHDEVTTLFHEFGHGLHHMLSRVDYPEVSGINGVAWDAVELPSQFMENWCWEPEGLALMSGHYETGEPLPQALLDNMLAAKHFQAGMMMVRQLEFSLFDFQLHQQYQPGQTNVQQVLDRVRDQVAVIRPPEENRFQHSFSHIFAGGYAAGYYSYKWAEVLSADAFSRFEEEGIFSAEAGADFRRHILEKGGSEEPMNLFVAFRGREPSVEALLRHNGIVRAA
ncbi:Oligopeptidase A [Nitrincola lacisaponensis]|uniref:oligopeptidase A n=1 Tax=Nitrincola lacisaponensis TaxID=267850 RepID=A0A063Y8D9_9GAMM|nr:oligopeptidase A [Nitrincola lacisaponensis]KDE41380.1 Oligopeptidase A [Nitrincola lacisaponensis]